MTGNELEETRNGPEVTGNLPNVSEIDGHEQKVTRLVNKMSH